MGKADEKKLYVGPEGGWVWFGIVIILDCSVIWREKGKGE